MRNQNLLFDPRRETFELTGGGGQHGMTLDDWGRTYVCGNSDPFHLLMYDSRYLARNPYLLAPPAARERRSGGQVHQAVPHQPGRAVADPADAAPQPGRGPGLRRGGHASGFFTGATGVTVYRGDAFPAEYRGNLFVGDVSNNSSIVPSRNPTACSSRPGLPRPGANSSPRATASSAPSRWPTPRMAASGSSTCTAS